MHTCTHRHTNTPVNILIFIIEHVGVCIKKQQCQDYTSVCVKQCQDYTSVCMSVFIVEPSYKELGYNKTLLR